MHRGHFARAYFSSHRIRECRLVKLFAGNFEPASLAINGRKTIEHVRPGIRYADVDGHSLWRECFVRSVRFKPKKHLTKHFCNVIEYHQRQPRTGGDNQSFGYVAVAICSHLDAVPGNCPGNDFFIRMNFGAQLFGRL